jgi:two-component system, NarL family, sensor histidine kinase UhpB
MSDPASELTPTAPTPVAAWRDLLIVITITLACVTLAAYFELNEIVFSLTRRWEPMQLDEWPVALLVFAVCMGWLSWRRYREAFLELGARREAEARLAAALAENRQLAHQHLRIQETERKHLARELHDELGQYLNAIKLDALSVAEGGPGDGAAVAHAAERIAQAADHVYGVVSDMIRRLRPAGLDELGLTAALENCVDQWRQRLPDTRFSLSFSGALDELGEVQNLTLYRLIQEGLTNSYKHSGAARIDIGLRREAAGARGDELVLTLSDDGRGMDPSRVGAGYGLSGMRERVEMMGGRLTLDSAPGCGFALEARWPATAEGV